MRTPDITIFLTFRATHQKKTKPIATPTAPARAETMVVKLNSSVMAVIMGWKVEKVAPATVDVV